MSKGRADSVEMKHMRFSPSRSAVLLAALAFMLLCLPTLSSVPTGVGQMGGGGCICHGGDSEQVSVSIIGLPSSFQSDTSYNLSIAIVSTIAEKSDGHQGGFRLSVQGGGTIAFDNSTATQELDDGWTHEIEGTYQRGWNFTWTSSNESTDPVEFIVHGNAVNGNNMSSGDAWNSFGRTIAHVDNPIEIEQPVFDREIGLLDWLVFTLGLSTLVFCLVRVVR